MLIYSATAASPDGKQVLLVKRWHPKETLVRFKRLWKFRSFLGRGEEKTKTNFCTSSSSALVVCCDALHLPRAGEAKNNIKKGPVSRRRLSSQLCERRRSLTEVPDRSWKILFVFSVGGLKRPWRPHYRGSRAASPPGCSLTDRRSDFCWILVVLCCNAVVCKEER